MKAKRWLAILLAAIMCVLMMGCNSGNENGGESQPQESTGENQDTGADSGKDGGKVFGYTCMDMTNPFHIAMRDSIQEKVEANGDTLVSIDGKNDQTKQNDAIDDMIASGISALFLNPVDSQSVKPALEACQAAGIPVINVDSGVADTDLIDTFISSNNFQAGKICGEEIAELYPDGAKICLIDNPLAESVVQRIEGLEEGIKGSKVEIADKKSYKSADAVLGDAEDLLQANPDTDIFFGLNDDVGLIIQGAVESAGMSDQVKVFTVDGSPSGKKSVANQGLYATAAQSPVEIGVKAVECAYAVLNGETIEKEYSIDTVLLTPDNIEDYEVDDWN